MAIQCGGVTRAITITRETAPTTALFCACAHDAPPLPGACGLAAKLARPVPVALPGKPATRLSVGRYLYCGSARGPGGVTPVSRG